MPTNAQIRAAKRAGINPDEIGFDESKPRLDASGKPDTNMRRLIRSNFNLLNKIRSEGPFFSRRQLYDRVSKERLILISVDFILELTPNDKGSPFDPPTLHEGYYGTQFVTANDQIWKIYGTSREAIIFLALRLSYRIIMLEEHNPPLFELTDAVIDGVDISKVNALYKNLLKETYEPKYPFGTFHIRLSYASWLLLMDLECPVDVEDFDKIYDHPLFPEFGKNPVIIEMRRVGNKTYIVGTYLCMGEDYCLPILIGKYSDYQETKLNAYPSVCLLTPVEDVSEKSIIVSIESVSGLVFVLALCLVAIDTPSVVHERTVDSPRLKNKGASYHSDVIVLRAGQPTTSTRCEPREGPPLWTVRPHDRRGYWRNQRVGKDRLGIKRVWVRDTSINKLRGDVTRPKTYHVVNQDEMVD
jgi:hypothetical protein